MINDFETTAFPQLQLPSSAYTELSCAVLKSNIQRACPQKNNHNLHCSISQINLSPETTNLQQYVGLPAMASLSEVIKPAKHTFNMNQISLSQGQLHKD